MIRLVFRGTARAVAAIAFVASLASAQDARLVARFDARTVAAVTRVVDSARTRSLPTEPLVQKALQGAAKRAPSERVVAAVRELLGELAIARASLGAHSTEPELVAGAGALHAGVPGPILTRIRAARGARSVTVALATLADLIARGVPVQGAVNAVLALASRGAADAELLAFSTQVGRDIAAGAPPAVAVRVRSVSGAGAAAGGARPAPPVRPGNPTPPAGGGRPAGQVPPGPP